MIKFKRGDTTYAAGEPPMPGNVLQTVVELGPDYGQSGRFDTTNPAEAMVTTSMTFRRHSLEGKIHRPVLDLDFPAKLIPSSTEGHFHLYLDVDITHDKYMALLDALATAGVLEEGYVSASKERGYTAVRLPWVKKGEA